MKKVECVRFSIAKRTADICDSFFLVSESNYSNFMDAVAQVSQDDKTLLFDLENEFIKQTREAIDFAYRVALKDVLISNDIDHRLDHILTTRTMISAHISHE